MDDMTDHDERPSRRVLLAVIALVVLLFLCSSCCVLAEVLQRNGIRSPLWLTYGTRVCAGVSTMDYPQVGIGWEVPRKTLILSSMGPPILWSPYALCVDVPLEVPFLPMRGALMFPP